jgi:acyl carrier protein
MIKELQLIFQDIFDDKKIKIQRETSAKDIEKWDSLNNIKLIITIEQLYRIRFSPSEITDIPNVGSLIDLIQSLVDKHDKT